VAKFAIQQMRTQHLWASAIARTARTRQGLLSRSSSECQNRRCRFKGVPRATLIGSGTSLPSPPCVQLPANCVSDAPLGKPRPWSWYHGRVLCTLIPRLPPSCRPLDRAPPQRAVQQVAGSGEPLTLLLESPPGFGAIASPSNTALLTVTARRVPLLKMACTRGMTSNGTEFPNPVLTHLSALPAEVEGVRASPSRRSVPDPMYRQN
jgi:hypothetical protein